MNCRPEVLLHRNPAKPKISVILIDWGVRESFHCLHYLNRQTADRKDYELIWLEFYDRKPEALQRLVAQDVGVLDQWYVLGYPDDVEIAAELNASTTAPMLIAGAYSRMA